MDIGSIFLILTLALLVGLFVGRPFFVRNAGGRSTLHGSVGTTEHAPYAAITQEERTLSMLLAEKDGLIISLQELDFDHTLSKIPEADYPMQRAFLLQRGVDILRKIDASHGTSELAPSDTPAEAAEERLEAAIATRRVTSTPSPTPVKGIKRIGEVGVPTYANDDDDLETLIAARRRERQDRSNGFCPKCGRPVQKSDRFCPKCGTTLAQK